MGRDFLKRGYPSLHSACVDIWSQWGGVGRDTGSSGHGGAGRDLGGSGRVFTDGQAPLGLEIIAPLPTLPVAVSRWFTATWQPGSLRRPTASSALQMRGRTIGAVRVNQPGTWPTLCNVSYGASAQFKVVRQCGVQNVIRYE